MIYTKSIVSAGPQAVSPLATELQDNGAGAPLVRSIFFFFFLCFDVCDFWVLFPLATRVWAWDETWAELGKKRGKDMLFRLERGKTKKEMINKRECE